MNYESFGEEVLHIIEKEKVMSMKQSQKCKKWKNVWRVIGGIVFTASMYVIMPIFIEKGSDYLYKKRSHSKKGG